MNKPLDTPSNVIDLSSFRFPVGTKAWHDTYRICQIVKSMGDERTIKILLLGMEEMVFDYVTVHVNELEVLTIPPELK